MAHYRAFIDMAEGLEAARGDLEGASLALDALAADLAPLRAARERFTASAARFTAGRAQNKQLLSALVPGWASFAFCIWHCEGAKEVEREERAHAELGMLLCGCSNRKHVA